MGDTNVDTNVLLSLFKAFADAQIAAWMGLVSGYLKVKLPSFSGKKQYWPLFKMQLQAYSSTFGLEGVLEETFEKDLLQQQYLVLDVMDTTQAIQGDAR